MSDLTMNFVGALALVGGVLSLALVILWLSIRSIRPEISLRESETKSFFGEAENTVGEPVERTWDSGAKT